MSWAFYPGQGALIGLALIISPQGTSLAAQNASAREALIPMSQTSASSTDTMKLCLQSWDANTHMSKREWRIACKRTVREYPDAYR